MTDHAGVSNLDQLTKRAVRSFWMDGLWELAIGGAFLLVGFWGMLYVQFVAFPDSTWTFLSGIGKNSIWLGLLGLVIVLALYIWFAWVVVKRLKRIWISPYMGHAEHRFFMPVESKVYWWYFILYLSGIGLLYGLFAWTKGGAHVMSVPFIMSPAAIFWAIGRIYSIRRYQWFSIIGLLSAIFLELLLTWPTAYQKGPQNFLNVRPEWGSPALPCFVWSTLFLISGLIGFLHVRRQRHED